MRKNIFRLLATLVLFTAGKVQAGECFENSCCYEDCYCANTNHFYIKGFGGANFLQNSSIAAKTKYDTGFIVASSIGYKLNNQLSIEAEYAYRRNDVKRILFAGEGFSKRGHFQTSSWMGNLIWGLSLSSLGCAFENIEAFIGAGAGYDFQQMSSSNSRIRFYQKWQHFSWQVMGGLSYPVLCNTNITLEYKFHQGGCHFNNHSVGLGLAYQFGDGLFN